jgi:dipeptidyl aminopeptidase/acylaminoacyl peptidase
MTELPPFEQFYAYRRFQPVVAFDPDGEHVLFSSNISGQYNLWRVPVGGGWPDQLTAFTDRTVRGAAVRRQDGAIVVHADRDGDEFHQLFAIPPEGGWPEQLTDAPQVQHFVLPDSWSPDGTRLAYSANAATPTDMEVWIRDADSGETRSVFGRGMYAAGGRWSRDGTRLTALEARSNSDASIHLVDVASGESRELTPHDDDAVFAPGPWRADGGGFWFVTDYGREHLGIAFYDLGTDSWDWVEATDHDIDELAGSPDGRFLAWVENVDGWAHVRVRDVDSGHDFPQPELPQGSTFIFGSGLTFSPDGSRLALIWDQPLRPQEVYVVDVATGEAHPVTESRLAGLRADRLVGPELVSYESFDGRQIPAWLYRPQREEPVPVVVAIHGGPEAQERPTYKGLFQYLASRGFAVLATNIRGSTGYGKTYQRLIHRDWGGADLEDWRHAAEWLRAQEWVDPDRLAVYGGSYGGFACLSCLTRLPEYWAAGVDIVGPSNLVTFARAVPPAWKRFMAGLVGDPETEEEFLLERSPLTYIDDIRAPLLVIQGAMDPRVVKAESDQLVERLRELGREVAYEVFEDEGHGFTRFANEVKAYKRAADFLERHLAREREPAAAAK